MEYFVRLKKKNRQNNHQGNGVFVVQLSVSIRICLDECHLWS